MSDGCTCDRVGPALGTFLFFGALTGVAAGVTRVFSPDKVKWVAGIGGGVTLAFTAMAYASSADWPEDVERIDDVVRDQEPDREVPSEVCEFAEYVRWACQEAEYGHVKMHHLIRENRDGAEKLKAIAEGIVAAGVPTASADILKNKNRLNELAEIFKHLGAEGYELAQQLQARIPDFDVSSLYDYVQFCDRWPSAYDSVDFLKSLVPVITADQVREGVQKWEAADWRNPFSLEPLVKALEGQIELLKVLGDELVAREEPKKRDRKELFKKVLKALGGEGFEFAKGHGKVSTLYEFFALFEFKSSKAIAGHFAGRSDDAEFAALLDDIIAEKTICPEFWAEELISRLPEGHVKLEAWTELALARPEVASGVLVGLAKRSDAGALIDALLPKYPWQFLHKLLSMGSEVMGKIDAHLCEAVRNDPSLKAKVNTSDHLLWLPAYARENLTVAEVIGQATTEYGREQAIPLIRAKHPQLAAPDEQIDQFIQVVHCELEGDLTDRAGVKAVGDALFGEDVFAPFLWAAEGKVEGTEEQKALCHLYQGQIAPNSKACDPVKLFHVGPPAGLRLEFDWRACILLVDRLQAGFSGIFGKSVASPSLFEIYYGTKQYKAAKALVQATYNRSALGNMAGTVRCMNTEHTGVDDSGVHNALLALVQVPNLGELIEKQLKRV